MNLSKCAPGLFFTVLLFLISCEKIEYYHEDGSEITAAEAVEIVRPILRKFDEEGMMRVWSIGKNPIPARTTLKYGPFGNYDPSSKYCGTFKSPNFKAWLVMIRPNMLYDGPSDESLCVFVDVRTGKYTETSIRGQLSDIEWDRSFSIIGDVPPSTSYYSAKTEPKIRRGASSTSGLYAVIISGGVDTDNNFSRYWNNCQYIYQKLTQTLGYDESHIYCLVADGTDPAPDMTYAYDAWTNTYYCKSSPLDFDNDGDNDIQYSATKTSISTVFNLLQSQAASIEHLLVFVTDHGTEDGKICLWGDNQELSPAELYTELDKLSGVRMDIVLGQCYSGAFIPTYGGGTRTFTTSCSATEKAWSQGYFSYSYFLRSWTDAFDPTIASTVDTNNDNMVSLREAFVYAAANDPMAINDSEHPQYASFPLVYGYTHDLRGNDNCPVISGNKYLSCNTPSTYTLAGLPSGTSVTWTSSSDINLTSPTNTSVIAQGSLPANVYVSHLANIRAYFSLEGIQYCVIKDIPSIWKPGVYYGYNHIYGGSGHYAVETGEGASGYHWSSDNSAWVVMYPWGSPEVSVLEGQTWNPVTLWVTFQDPWGNSIVTCQQFNPSY
jgi:hypothetical protein